MTATEYRNALDALPFGKRLPGAVYLLDPGDDARIAAAGGMYYPRNTFARC